MTLGEVVNNIFEAVPFLPKSSWVPHELYNQDTVMCVVESRLYLVRF